MARSHPILAIATGAYLLLIVTFTFVGSDEQPPPPHWWSLVAFIGVGALLCAVSSRRRWWVALGFGVLGAAWIEMAQTIWRPEYASLADLVLGVVGAVIGVVVVVLVRRLTAPRTAAPAAALRAERPVAQPRP